MRLGGSGIQLQNATERGERRRDQLPRTLREIEYLVVGLQG